MSLRSITTEVLKVLNATEELLQGMEGGDEPRVSTPSALPPNIDPKKLDQQFSRLEENVSLQHCMWRCFSETVFLQIFRQPCSNNIGYCCLFETYVCITVFKENKDRTDTVCTLQKKKKLKQFYKNTYSAVSSGKGHFTIRGKE